MTHQQLIQSHHYFSQSCHTRYAVENVCSNIPHVYALISLHTDFIRWHLLFPPLRRDSGRAPFLWVRAPWNPISPKCCQSQRAANVRSKGEGKEKKNSTSTNRNCWWPQLMTAIPSRRIPKQRNTTITVSYFNNNWAKITGGIWNMQQVAKAFSTAVELDSTPNQQQGPKVPHNTFTSAHPGDNTALHGFQHQHASSTCATPSYTINRL